MECKTNGYLRLLIVLLALPGALWGSVRNQDTITSEEKTTPPIQRVNPPVPVAQEGLGLAENHEASEGALEDSSDRAVKAKGPERTETKIDFEPTDPNESYNQVRVRKPTIPTQLDERSNILNRQQGGSGSNSILDYIGLLGIPALVFSLLFFAMWGIISGRIQRLMV